MKSRTAVREPVRIRVRVDPVACDAYGFCAELLPERVTLDEWGYPVVEGAPVGPELVGLATRAAAVCPRRAFHLERTLTIRSRWNARRGQTAAARVARPTSSGPTGAPSTTG